MLLNLFKTVDLTQPLYANAPTWDGSCGYCLTVEKDYDKTFRVQHIKMHAGVGTHIDAPSHLIQGGLSITEIPFEQLITPLCIIDVSDRARADYEVSVEDIKQYEETYGIIPQGSLVVANTGWNRFWLDPIKYRNLDANGRMHFPAFSAKAAEFLLKRSIAGVAIDTLSPDCLDDHFPVHQLILGSGKYIIENIGDCSQVPSAGAYAIALPLRIETGTESPMRILGLISKNLSI